MKKTDILEHIEWARQTIKDKEMFGLDPLNASFSRERRANGALLSAKQAIEELRKELTYYKSKGLLTPKDILKENEKLKEDNKNLMERNQRMKVLGWQTVSAYYNRDRFKEPEPKDFVFDWKEAYTEFAKDLSFEIKPNFTEYANSIKTKIEEIKQLKELIDIFIVHSNGLSKYVRFPHYKERLLKAHENDLVEDLEDIYSYQCYVETELNKLGITL